MMTINHSILPTPNVACSDHPTRYDLKGLIITHPSYSLFNRRRQHGGGSPRNNQTKDFVGMGGLKGRARKSKQLMVEGQGHPTQATGVA
eukprot:749192-Hanusia_phi.AAC.1